MARHRGSFELQMILKLRNSESEIRKGVDDWSRSIVIRLQAQPCGRDKRAKISAEMRRRKALEEHRAAWKVAAFFLCAGFQSSRVIYLSAERKTQSCARDYAEEPLKTFNQRPTLSDAELAITSQTEICVSLPATLLRYVHTNRKREARIPGSGSSRELGAGISGADDKHRPLFQAFK
ncbi:hypothetical protein KOW79_006970 [Hemibagrus wyckioides]|uniref:Uncharacterized protein n=1 Tax=Hemibagrus wyckioides TaxID=337641 RepID=A0A9D3NSS9_9TELE|nr:hypothetical protein KOW79_006970 [Hemibagrus wyckioides]